MSIKSSEELAPTTGIIARAGLVTAIGRIMTRILGLMRVSVIASIFGRGLDMDAYTAAWAIPNIIYDLLLNGILIAVLVPILSEYAHGERRAYSRLVSSLINLVLVTLVLLVALLIWQTSLVAGFVVQTSRAELYLQTVYLIRLLLPSTFFLCLSGLTMALLYAKGNFILPTFAGSIFNAAIVLTVLGLHERLGVASIVAGVTIGGLAQFVLQLPGITDIRYQFLFDLQHPAIRRILRLYAPLVLGIGFSLIGLLIDRWLASGFPSALATMQYAFTIFYSPLGLVATPIALAILPTLARETARGDDVAFRATLAMGLKIALLFILPITFGLAVLAQPITAIVLQYGVFVARDTHATAEAMLYYAPGLPAAVVAQVLLFSCFARAETLLPSLLQGLAILLYLLSAFLLLHLTNLGYLALVASTTIQMIGYMLMLAWLLKRQGTSLHEYAWVRQSLRGS